MEDLLKSVIATLDTISIIGRDNMDKFLGCINALENIVKALEDSKKGEVREEPVNGGQGDIGAD